MSIRQCHWFLCRHEDQGRGAQPSEELHLLFPRLPQRVSLLGHDKQHVEHGRVHGEHTYNSPVRVCTVYSFYVIQLASLKTKNEHYIRGYFVCNRFSFFLRQIKNRKTNMCSFFVFKKQIVQRKRKGQCIHGSFS